MNLQLKRPRLSYLSIGLIGIWVIFFVFGIFGSINVYNTTRDFQSRGAKARGLVTDVETTGRNGHILKYRYGVFSSVDSRPTICLGDTVVSEKIFNAASVGDSLPIVYDRTDVCRSQSNFGNAVFVDTPLSAAAKHFFGIAILCAFMLFWIWRDYRKGKVQAA